MCSSTRRFCALPADVELVATGRSGPMPSTIICSDFTPRPVSTSRTAFALRSAGDRDGSEEDQGEIFPHSVSLVLPPLGRRILTRCSTAQAQAGIPQPLRHVVAGPTAASQLVASA